MTSHRRPPPGADQLLLPISASPAKMRVRDPDPAPAVGPVLAAGVFTPS